jgi:hypothetical protein
MNWEEYVSPGIDAEPQTLINKQLLRSYDMLIAIFGTKLGTPTGSHRSGTLEEIEHAIGRNDSVFGEYRVQVYFKDAIESLRDVDPAELSEVACTRFG